MDMPPENDPNFLYLSFIDVPLWDKAKWKAAVFMGMPDDSEPPFLGIGFENIEAGKKIFQGWRDRLGEVDRNEELRVSIVEGDIPKEEPGYSVVITTNLDKVLTRIKKTQPDYEPKHFALVSRMHRMNPAPGSPHLPNFKRLYAKFGRYYLMPVGLDMRTMQPTPVFDLALGKREVNFIDAPSIGRNDPEACLFGHRV